MKTYQSNTNDKKKNFFKRHWHALIVVAAVLVVALVVTLSVVLTLPESEPVTVPVDNPPIEQVESETVLPMSGATVGLGYSYDKLSYWETLEDWRVHPAIDFIGEGDVVAVRDGTVTAVDMHTALEGNVVTVTHADGYVSVYKSLGDDVAVTVGQEVKAGDKLGTASNSMLIEVKTGAHLHFELTKDGKPVDPTTILPLNEDK